MDKSLQINNKVVFAIIMNMCLGSFYFGCNISTYNSAAEVMITLNGWRGSTSEDLKSSLITSSLAAGCIIAAPFATTILRLMKNNLRKASMLTDLLSIIAFIVQIVDTNIVNLIIGRFIAGCIIAVNCTYVSLYISDVSPVSMRGITGCMNQLFICSGICITLIIGLILPNKQELISNPTYNNQFAWRVVVGFPVVFMLIRFFILLFVFRFDAPTQLYKQNRHEELKKFLKLIYADDSSVQEAFLNFQQTLNPPTEKLAKNQENNQTNSQHNFQNNDANAPITAPIEEDYEQPNKKESKIITTDSIIKANTLNNTLSLKNQKSLEDAQSYKKRWLLGLIMCIAQQLTCINGVMFYSNQIFEDANQTENATYFSIALGVIQVIATFFGAIFSEKFGRRPMMLWGTFSIGISLALIALFLSLDLFIPSFLSISLFLITFSLSQGPLLWAYQGEILDEKALQINTCVLWLFTLIIGLSFKHLVKALNTGFTFGMFSIITFLFLIYFIKEFVESKGKEKNQIYREFCKTTASMHSISNRNEDQKETNPFQT